MNLRAHLFCGFVVRLICIVYGVWQDEQSELQFTDVDYKVFTDAARNILEGRSPYERHTYRYSPLLAFLLLPNIFLTNIFGKVLFSLFDVLSTYVIHLFLRREGLTNFNCTFYSLIWLYNPMSVIISSRGNADSIIAFLMLLTLYEIQKGNLLRAGILHGLAIHFRLFPILFSLPMYFSLRRKGGESFWDLFYPNRKRMELVFSCVLSLSILTCISYILYGEVFLNESMIYHMKRVDIRHNYSVYFYTQYLSFGSSTGFLKLLTVLPQLILILVFSFVYNSTNDLPFCEFCIAFVFVTYNSVLTCQYFVWYLCLLPLFIFRISCSAVKTSFGLMFWLISQVTWLLPAYLLEFKLINSFLWIWIHGLLFFFSNIYVLSIIISGYERKQV